MSALPLARLETQPIAIPTYRNERLRSFADWFRDNDKVITAYYNAIRPYCEGEPLVDYWTFVALQHEREEMKLYESAAGTPSGADARPAQNISESGCGFKLIPFTPKGAAQLPEIEAKVEPAMELDPVIRQNALDWIDMPEWRVEELARKYAPVDAYEPDEVDDE